MKRKKAVASAIGVMLGGAVLTVTVQGSAQATPAAPVSQTAVTTEGAAPEDQPQVIGSLAAKAASAVGKAAGKATVHAKAAVGSAASNYGLIGSLYGASQPDVAANAPVSADVVFDK